MAPSASAIPRDLPGRLDLVGRTLFGEDFKGRLAEGLQIGRTTLYEMRRGRGNRRPDIVERLIDLLDREEDVASAHRDEIHALRRGLINVLKGDRRG